MRIDPRLALPSLLFLLASGVASADPAADHSALRRELVGELTGNGEHARRLETQIDSPESYQKLLQFAFLDTFTPQHITKLEAEPQGAEFIKALRGNSSWLRMLLSSGPINQPERSLDQLAALWKQDSACASDENLQTLSVAVALEYGRRDWPIDAAWTRYAFYRDSQQLELLHPSYDDLAAWEKRYLTGHSINLHGGAKSQLWLRDNVKLPAEGYRGACWQVAYRGHNFFGDSVQGPMYYFPFQGSFDSFSEMTRYVGGVCGRLSGYGAAAAVANGIPATTMGEPGHCAYTVRVAPGDWKPAYSLSWKRGVHVRFFDNGSYNFLPLTEAIFSDKQAHRAATAHLWQTRLPAASQPTLIRAAYLEAIKSQANNYEAWLAYGKWLTSWKAAGISDWQGFHQGVLRAWPDYPEIAWILISRFAYPHLLKEKSVEEKMRIFAAFHQSISDWGPNRWDFEGAIKHQVKLLAGEEKDQLLFFQGLLNCHKDSSAFSGPTLAWGQAQFSKSPELRKQMIVIATRCLSEGDNPDGEKALYQMANRLILDAEKNNDAETFEIAGSMLRHLDKGSAEDTKASAAFPGELLSEGAMVRVSGTSRYDTPWKHYFLPSNETGFFHTDRQSNPWVELTLKQFGDIRGIEIVNWTKFHGRAVPLKIEVSEDGITWQEIETLTKAQAVWKVDLKGKGVRARHLRLTKQGTDYLHLNNIRVYGQRRS